MMAQQSGNVNRVVAWLGVRPPMVAGFGRRAPTSGDFGPQRDQNAGCTQAVHPLVSTTAASSKVRRAGASTSSRAANLTCRARFPHALQKPGRVRQVDAAGKAQAHRAA